MRTHFYAKRMPTMKQFKKSIVIFRRDLRIVDNTALNAALEQSETVLPCFIFDPRQVGDHNEYKSDNAIAFMLESLADLQDQLESKHGHLYLFWGDPEKVIQKLIAEEAIEAVFVNQDYTPFSIKRDEALASVCRSHHAQFFSFHDALLNSPESVVSQTGTPYSVFTPFWKKSRTIAVAEPSTHRFNTGCLLTKRITGALSLKSIKEKITLNESPQRDIFGGRTEGLRILHKITSFGNYLETRDFPSLPTTHLSAHNKFGTVSVREIFHDVQDALGKDHGLLRQLYWRDFYTHLAYFSPFVFGQPMQEKYAKLRWSTSKKMFELWCQGKTGFPIVDAGMRQLNESGYMHNRVRMIVASFLVKDLHINWTWGEQYFAQKLVDYDPCVNNGNWQWSASTGADAQPYFRIFNPWLQQKKFDPECVYIKRWIPELKKITPATIHAWYESKIVLEDYPKPILEHSEQAELSKEMFRNC